MRGEAGRSNFECQPMCLRDLGMIRELRCEVWSMFDRVHLVWAVQQGPEPSSRGRAAFLSTAWPRRKVTSPAGGLLWRCMEFGPGYVPPPIGGQSAPAAWGASFVCWCDARQRRSGGLFGPDGWVVRRGRTPGLDGPGRILGGVEAVVGAGVAAGGGRVRLTRVAGAGVRQVRRKRVSCSHPCGFYALDACRIGVRVQGQACARAGCRARAHQGTTRCRRSRHTTRRDLLHRDRFGDRDANPKLGAPLPNPAFIDYLQPPCADRVRGLDRRRQLTSRRSR